MILECLCVYRFNNSINKKKTYTLAFLAFHLEAFVDWIAVVQIVAGYIETVGVVAVAVAFDDEIVVAFESIDFIILS